MTTALLIDVVIVLLCAGFLVGSGRISFSHPAVIYLGFHLLIVTFRLAALAAGAPTLFASWGPRYESVKLPELQRAAVLADVVLISMTAGFLCAAGRDRRRHDTRPSRVVSAEESPPTLSRRHINRVVIVALPIGAASLIAFSRFPQYRSTVDLQSGLQSSSWVFITTSWVGLCLLALIYWYGFRWKLILPLCAYLLIMMIQGGLRFRVLIPVLLLAMISLDRRGFRWPPKRLALGLIVMLALFYPLKAIGEQLQTGQGLASIGDTTRRSLTEVSRGESGDQQLFDEMASIVTLVDRRGSHYYGRMYVGLITLPIPRQIWAGKPDLSEYLEYYSTWARPMAEAGMVPLLGGEAYVNFGYPGLVLVPFMLALFLGRFYYLAYRRHFLSVHRFLYLMVACSLIQVYRDGLLSLAVFVLVQMMPLITIVILHRLRPLPSELNVAPPGGSTISRAIAPA